MSKSGNYFLELTEQANELGFESVQEAFDNGYEVVCGKLVEKKDEQTLAHEEWLKEKENIVGDLTNLYFGYCSAGKSGTTDAEIIHKAIDFIKRGEQ